MLRIHCLQHVTFEDPANIGAWAESKGCEVTRAGLEGKYSPHALRHTVGFELMRKTRNIRQVQEFLGHSSVTTTQIYTHVTKEELRHCAEILSL